MALATSSWTLDVVLVLVTVIFFSYLKFKFYGRYHWRRRQVPYLEPTYLLGNTGRATFFQSAGEIFQKIYMSNKEKSLLGIWFYSRPVLFVHDLEMIKNILVKDFQHFHDRGVRINEKLDPLDGHLFNIKGAKWRNLRVKLMPTFTSGKMKMMFPKMIECGQELQAFLEYPASREEDVEMKEVLARFTTDVISSCAFGIQTNSLKNPDAEFRKYGRRIFTPSKRLLLGRTLATAVPILQKVLPIRRREKDVSDFFLKVVKETVEAREQGNIQRRDFMDLLIQLKNKGQIEDADLHSGPGDKETQEEFTFEQLAAQAFVFFAAGFETSSTAMQFALYELALNPPLQTRVQKEVDKVLERHKNEVTYEAMQEMTLLEAVVNESLRKYSPAPMLIRECTKDYTFPGTEVKIEKGTFLILPINGIQNDPQYFPDPERFDPDRFSPEEKNKRDHFLHIPFGEGPRICIGNRFGMLQSKTGLLFILSKYNVHVTETTPVPMKLDPSSFIPSPAGGMNLGITHRNLASAAPEHFG